MSCATIIPLTTSVLRSAATNVWDLEDRDSIMLASVVGHLDEKQPDESCFINKDSDFSVASADPMAADPLKERGCQLIPSFQNGLRYIESRLPRPADGS